MESVATVELTWGLTVQSGVLEACGSGVNADDGDQGQPEAEGN